MGWSRFFRGKTRDASIKARDIADSQVQAGQGNIAAKNLIVWHGDATEQLQHTLKEAMAARGEEMVVVTSSSRPDTRDFVGREQEVHGLVEMVRSGAHTIIGISDQAGNGKSTLAMRAVEGLADLKAFPRTSWIRFWPGDGFDDLTARLLAEMGIEAEIADPRKRIDAIVQALGQPILLVFDAFEHVLGDDGHCKDRELGEFLRTLSGSQHQACVLLTTRRRPADVEPSLRAYAAFPSSRTLGGLEPEAAVQKLRNERIAGDDALLDEAARSLGGNPKALELLAGYLQRHHGGDAGVLTERPELIGRGIEELVEQIVGSLSAGERTLACRAAVLRRPVPSEALVALSDEAREEVETAITSLREQSVLDRGEEDELWTVHSIVRDRLASPPEPEAHRLAASYYASIQPPAGLAPKSPEDVYMLLEGTYHALEAGDWRLAEDLVHSSRFGATRDEALVSFLVRRGFAATAVELEELLAAAIPESEPEAWAHAQNSLGIAYSDLPTGDRGENLGKAIAAYQAALRVYTERDYPANWAGTQNNLGNAYVDLPTGDRGENLNKAIAAYEAALRIRTERDYPPGWAMTQNNLGEAYRQLPTGDRAGNLRRAIAAYEAALRVRTEQDYPADWAGTQNNLGNAYGGLPTGDRGENLNKAIAAYETALRVYTEQDYPTEWAMAQNNLGEAYRQLPTGARGENLGQAIGAFQGALRVYTEREYPERWAGTQNNLGNAYGGLPTGDRGENLNKAIAAYEAALRVHTERDYPANWAMTQNNLGVAYRNLPAGDRAENLRKAIDAYGSALRVYTEQDYPASWAMTQNNLGTAYAGLPTGDRGENLNKTIDAFEAALRVYSEEAFPERWAITQNNLGNAYAGLPTGDRGENLRKAIDAYEAALRVRTERDYPAAWAGTQNNLGNAYGGLPTGDRGENLNKAIDAYHAALRVYTEEAYPERWAVTQGNLRPAQEELRELREEERA